MKALWEKRLKVARYGDLNDPFELLPFDLRKKRSRAFWIDEATRYIDGATGMLCFSSDWRSMLMWSHYGERHTGICLGFDVPRRIAIKVRYIDTPRPAPPVHAPEHRATTDDVFEKALRFKNRGWSYEKEWRVKVPLLHAVDGLHFKNFDDSLHLREVVLGARCSMVPGDVVEAVIYPPLDVEIFRARTAFDRFEVCRHELVETHTKKGFRAALALARDVYADELPDEERADS